MAQKEDIPSELIKNLFLDRPEVCTDISTGLLRALSHALGNLIGKLGFESLLSRVMRRVTAEYPWLQLPDSSDHDPEFDWLRQSFQGQSESDISAASIRLFSAFVEALTVLIGAHLTDLIFKNAIDRAGKQERQGA